MYDIFFLSHNEPLAELHWQKLLAQHPHARRPEPVDGILDAHRRCAQLSRTSHFFVVDADNEILEVDFRLKLSDYDQGYVHIWRAKNPVNGLVYGWGGVKLFPKKLLLNRDTMPLDMTTSFPLKIVNVIGSITHFNMTSFDTWRSAFREAVKLSCSQDIEARERLEVWCTVANGSYAEWCLKGAQAGRMYAIDHRDDQEALMKINDWNWLKERFDGKEA